MNNNKKELTARDLAMFLGCPVETPHGRGKLNSVNWLSDHATVTFGAMGPDFDLSMPASDVRPVLRPLSDMTITEKTAVAKMLFCDEAEEPTWRLIEKAGIAIRDNFGTPLLASWRIGFLVFDYLLSNHFDVFDWIPAGLAVDATKKEVKP